MTKRTTEEINADFQRLHEAGQIVTAFIPETDQIFSFELSRLRLATNEWLRLRPQDRDHMIAAYDKAIAELIKKLEDDTITEDEKKKLSLAAIHFIAYENMHGRTDLIIPNDIIPPEAFDDEHGESHFVAEMEGPETAELMGSIEGGADGFTKH